MVIGACSITLIIHESRSLKEKRQVVKSIVGKVRNRFNVSVAEVADHELWGRAEIGVSVVGSERAHINSVLDKVLNYIEELYLAEVLDHRIEIISL